MPPLFSKTFLDLAIALVSESNSSMRVLWSLFRMALRRDLTLVSKASKARVLADFTTRTDSEESVVVFDFWD